MLISGQVSTETKGTIQSCGPAIVTHTQTLFLLSGRPSDGSTAVASITGNGHRKHTVVSIRCKHGCGILSKALHSTTKRQESVSATSVKAPYHEINLSC